MADPRRLLLAASALTGLVAVTVGLAAGPVIGQPSPGEPTIPASESDAATPKSLLPESFEGPPLSSNQGPLLPTAPADGSAAPLVGGPPLLSGAPTSTAPETVDPFAIAVPTGRDISVWGPLTPAAGGYGPAVFNGSRGPFLAGLMRRMDAPLASRWAAITLRRALLSESAAPAGIVAGDWVAARAWLLLRNGEIDGAKALVDPVPIDRYSPLLYKVAGQTALAAADIGGLCPIAVTGRLLSPDPLWPLAIGMCAAVQGDDITAARVFDDLRDSDQVDPFDVRLGERVATIAGGAGRASNIDWGEAPRLTPFRYGVATAAGVPVPADRLAALGPAHSGWIVRAPGVLPEARLAALRQATVLGTMSATELASSVSALSPAGAEPDTRAGQLRQAFVGTSAGDRRAALRDIWASGGDGDGRYGALLESATAAARLPVTADAAADSPQIIAALLAAGNSSAARRWWPVADLAGGRARAEAWALLATGGGNIPVTPADFSAWRSATSADARHAGLLLAGLAGLGLANGVEWTGLRSELLPRNANSWTRAIDAAATAGRLGEVTILAATGLQGAWADVPPLHLYHIVAALNRAGRTEEARLIAAEAMTRA
jgi:hypothetical protein